MFDPISSIGLVFQTIYDLFYGWIMLIPEPFRTILSFGIMFGFFVLLPAYLIATEKPIEGTGKVPAFMIVEWQDEAGHKVTLPNSAISWYCRECGGFVRLHPPT